MNVWDKHWKRFFSLIQQNSAADLSMLVLESLEKSEAKVEDDVLGECLSSSSTRMAWSVITKRLIKYHAFLWVLSCPVIIQETFSSLAADELAV